MPSRPRIYIGNMPFTTTEDDIRAFFVEYKLTDVKIILDHETGRPRGFGFVEVEDPASQKAAITKLHGQQMGGRSIVVSEAKERGANGGERAPRQANGAPRSRDRNWE